MQKINNKKIKWTTEENKKLFDLIKKYGENNWKEIYKNYPKNI